MMGVDIVLEKNLRKSTITYLRKRFPAGWWTGTMGTAALAGLPDIMGTCPELGGRLVGIELKVGDNQASKLQAWVLERLRAAGGIAGVARNLDDVSAIVEEGRKEWERDRRPSTW